MKRILSIFALMLVCIGQAFAYEYYHQSATNYGSYYLYLNVYSSEGFEVTYGTNYNSYKGSYTIPGHVYAYLANSGMSETTRGMKIIRIGNSAFQNCNSLSSVHLPETVTSIGSTAFGGCSSLTSLEIPESVTSIGSSAFYGCISI